MKFPIFLLSCTTALCLSGLSAETHSASSRAEQRANAANVALAGPENEVAIFTQGAICGSCGLGIRILVGRLDGVDKSMHRKGVSLDVENQLVVVAFEDGFQPEMKDVFQAIYDAGYDPVHYYVREGDVVALKQPDFQLED